MAFTCIDLEAQPTTRLEEWPVKPQEVKADRVDSTVDFSDLQVGAFTVKRTIKAKATSQISYAISGILTIHTLN
jgi:hypothetical protein